MTNVVKTEVAVVGAGLAGSLTAAMLGRAGIDVALIDPRPEYPADFRCEKLDGGQVRILERTGIAPAVLAHTTWDRESWVARFGHVVEKRLGDQHGIRYQDLVNAVRGQVPPQVKFIEDKATAITAGPDRQTVTLGKGDTVDARLVVLANGLNVGARHTLGLSREVLSECHSISIGFDVKPVGRAAFDFRALTYYPERDDQQSAYITLFPIGDVTRANLFAYRDMEDPWLRDIRQSPRETLLNIMPGLAKLMGDFEVVDTVKVRPIDLYISHGHRQAGVVLVGDAFSTSCPAAGTGAFKALTDVERLCNVHVPAWLASPGMSEEKIAAFYDDEVKKACDEFSLEKAYSLRQFSTDSALPFAARRWLKFIGHYGVGTIRQWRWQASEMPRAG